MSAPSPTRSLRRSPPRRPLHERSDSHVNEISQPTLRVIGDSDAKIYASTPFPTQPSQILSPNGRKRQSVFEDSAVSVSDRGPPTATSEEQGPQLKRPSKDKEIASSKYNHGFESELPITSPDLPPALFEKRKKTESLATGIDKGKRRAMDYGIDEERISDEIVELPSVPSRRHSGSETYDFSPFEAEPSEYSRPQGVISKSSDHSLSSAGSTDTVVKHNVQNQPSRGSYTVFPPSSRFALSPSTPLDPALYSDDNSLSPVSSTSPTSSVSPLSATAPVFPSFGHRDSFPTQETREESIDRVPSLQYAVVRPPVASGSWAKSSTIAIPKRAVRMNDSNETRKWSPHLSTVQSEATGERSSSSTRHERIDMQSSSSSMAVDRSSTSSRFPTLPVPALVPRRDSSGSTIRVVGEESDVVTDMPSPNLRSYNFGFPSLVSADSRRGSTITTRPGSRGSFLRDSIPAWARYEQILAAEDNSEETLTLQRTYYAHEARNATLVTPSVASEPSDSRPGTRNSISSLNFPAGIFRTRSRVQQMNSTQPNRDSMAITPADPVNEEIDNEEIEITGSPRRKISQPWSPHLWHDRRNAKNRRTIFKAPSLDEAAEGNAPSRRNTQVWLFALGFLVPLGMCFRNISLAHILTDSSLVNRCFPSSSTTATLNSPTYTDRSECCS